MNNVTQELFDLLNSVFKGQLPKNISSLRLFLDIDSPPKLEVDYYPTETSPYINIKTYNIKEESDDGINDT